MDKSKNRIFIGLIVTNIFIASFLLFVIQPMAAKIIVPQLGGAAATWSYCLLFFQGSLLLGYLYSYLLRRFFAGLIQVYIHLSICLLLFYFTPSSTLFSSALNENFLEHSFDYSPLINLFSPIFLPIVLISSMTGLLQSWWQDRDPQKIAPYQMYATSNFACLLALFTYLFFGGTYLLDTQWNHWLIGYKILVAITAVICVLQGVFNYSNQKSKLVNSSKEIFKGFSSKKIFVEASVPSALLTALSTYLATLTASVPMVWLIPLSIYLISYMIAFSGKNILRNFIEKIWPAAGTFAIIIYILAHKLPTGLVVISHIICFTLISLGIHQQLYNARPIERDKKNLSEFYLILTSGAAIGTLFSSFIAPFLFDSFFEVPACYVLARFVFSPAAKENSKKPIRITTTLKLLPLFLLSSWIWLSYFSEKLEQSIYEFSFIVWIPLSLTLFFKRPKIILIAATGFAVMITHKIWSQKNLFQDRSFYAPLTVRQSTPELRELINGETVHGRQSIKNPREPLSYYHRQSGLGLFLEKFNQEIEHVAAVGMGVGTLSAYLNRGQKVDYFELDPEVIDLIENQDLFTYVKDGRERGVETNIFEGDARISIEKNQSKFDLVIVDAFLSSSIPVHLLTAEAIDLYLRRLSSSGVILFHVSNKYLDFESVFAEYSRISGVKGFIKRTSTGGTGKDAAAWVALVKTDHYEINKWFYASWNQLSKKRNLTLWTDQKANILEILF